MLGINQIKCLLPAYPHEFILAAYALRLLRRGEIAFSHHRIANASFTVHLFAHRCLQRVGEGGVQRAAGRNHIFTIRLHQHWPPVGRG